MPQKRYLARRNGITRNEQFGEYVVQVPLERLAAQILAQLLPAGYISVVALAEC